MARPIFQPIVSGDCLSCSRVILPRSGRCLASLDTFGFGLETVLLFCVACACGHRLILYVLSCPPSIVRVRMLQTLDRSAVGGSGPACGSSQLFISLYLHRPMKGVDTCLDLSICGFLFRRSAPFVKTGIRFSSVLLFNIPVELRPKLLIENLQSKIVKGEDWHRGGADDPCCYSKKFDSLKNWNNCFFWIDASVCLFSTPWFNGTSVVKDSLPVDEAVDLPCVELLNENRTLIRKYPETFLCLVGLSRSFIKTGIRPTLLYDNDEGRLERTLADNEVPLNTKTGDRVLSPSAQTISLVDHTIQDELNFNSCKWKRGVAFVSGSPPVKKAWAEGIVISNSRPSTTGKSPSALRRLSRQNEQADTGSGSVAPATEDVTSFSVTPTPERVLEDVSDDNVRTCPPSGHFVILSYVTADTDLPDSPQVVPPATSATTGVNAPVGDGRRLSGSGPEAGALSATPSQGSSADVTTLPFAGTFLIMSLLLVTRQLFASAYYESEYLRRSLMIVLQCPKGWEIAYSEAWLEKNVGLVERVSALESERDSLKNQVVGEGKMREKFVSQQDATKRRFAKCAAELDARIADVRRDMDNDLYPHMLTAIAGRRWVVGHGFRLAVYKCARSVECRSALGKVEAYDLEVEGKYVATVSEFEGVSFPLLDELEGLKDSPLALIMYALTLKDGQGNKDATPEFAWFQPSIDLVYVPVYSESGSVDREMLLSDVIPAIRQSAERRGLCPPSSSASGGTSGLLPSYDSSLGCNDYMFLTLVLGQDGDPLN
ncbi:hypothetical protein Tco_0489404 [Tanacetum coccineum]